MLFPFIPSKRRIAAALETYYIAVGTNVSDYFGWGKSTNENVTVLTKPTSPPNGGSGLYFCTQQWDPTGTYLAVAYTTSPYLRIYKRTGDTLSAPLTLSANITGVGRSLCWSKTGKYLAVAHDTSPFISVYKRSGDSFTKLANPTTLPVTRGFTCAFSPDESMIVVTCQGSPYVRVYTLNQGNDTLTNVTSHGISFASYGNCIAFSHDGTYLFIGTESAPYLWVWEVSGTTFTPRTNLLGDTVLPGGVFSISLSPDDSRILIVYNNAGSFVMRILSGVKGNWNYNYLLPAASTPTDPIRAVFGYDAKYVFFTRGGSPYLGMMRYDAATDKYVSTGSIPDFPKSSFGVGYAIAVHPSAQYQ